MARQFGSSEVRTYRINDQNGVTIHTVFAQEMTPNNGLVIFSTNQVIVAWFAMAGGWLIRVED